MQISSYKMIVLSHLTPKLTTTTTTTLHMYVTSNRVQGIKRESKGIKVKTVANSYCKYIVFLFPLLKKNSCDEIKYLFKEFNCRI